jgi:hypothetical protein
MRKIVRYSSATLLAIFGLMTLFLSASIILNLFGIREKEGNYVLFVVWVNFICSFLYLSAAYGFFKARRWTLVILGAASLILTIAFFSFNIYVSNGGIHEPKTEGALIFRFGVTLFFIIVAWFTFFKSSGSKSAILPE